MTASGIRKIPPAGYPNERIWTVHRIVPYCHFKPAGTGGFIPENTGFQAYLLKVQDIIWDLSYGILEKTLIV